MAICSTSEDLDTALVPERFARAPYFALFSLDGAAPQVLTNPAQERQGGASAVAVATLARAGATRVVARRFGEKARQALESAGIELCPTASITVQEALVKLQPEMKHGPDDKG